MKIKNIFVTGGLKTGKSTVIQKVLTEMDYLKIGGFRTMPIMENNSRSGFSLNSFDGQSFVFAHTNLTSKLKFDIYRYDASVFENNGVSILERALKDSELIVMDEIGVMEKETIRFRESVLHCLDAPIPVLGAFQKRAAWFYEILKERKDTKIFFVDEGNRDKIHEEILTHFRLHIYNIINLF